MLKSKKLLKLIILIAVGLISSVVIFWNISGSVLTQWDFQALDFFYTEAVNRGYSPESSSQIIYLTITDDTYEYFGKNILDRADLAMVNTVLSNLGPEAVAYDIIFPRPSNPVSDKRFSESIKSHGRVYLPIAFQLSPRNRPFNWEEGIAYERFRTNHLKNPVEKGTSNPFYATQALMQLDDFALAAFNSGHINAQADKDGVYRHFPVLIKVDSKYFPALALSMFLDYINVSFDELIIDWGNEIIIPATDQSILNNDVVIPIDNQGRTFIPFVNVWNKDFKQMGAHTLLKYFENENLQGNLLDFFEGKFVFVADVSHGISDSGQTPLEDGTPLVSIHAALLNGLLENTFYREWSFHEVINFIILISIISVLSAFPILSWVMFVSGSVIFISIIGLTWIQITRFYLFPIVTVGSSFLFVFFGLIIGLQIVISKDQVFIRNTFSRYVPEKVVNELLSHPELLHLGGEERRLTVLFLDLVGFTEISEKMAPSKLVSLLNQCFTEMTEVIISEGGIIDKYQGDAIMAEFGAPVSVPHHADMAVKAGLKMQQRLHKLRKVWARKRLPQLNCRIGINTGLMIIGNMGSKRVFDYTVMGDAVNLASRLEGANKKYDTHLMISEFTYKSLSQGMFRARILDVIKVKGKTEAIKVYEVYGGNSNKILKYGNHVIASPDDLQYYQTYHEAFEAYLSRDFVTAKKKFISALSLRPEDPASKQLISRVNELNTANLPDNWDGSIVLESK